MPDSVSDLETQLATLRTRRQTTAGIRGTSFSDQSTTFDGQDLDRAIVALEQRLQTARGRSSTRFAATSKGC